MGAQAHPLPHIELAWLENVPRARRPRRLPTVLTREEAHLVLAQISGTHALMARLLYGTGMRLSECLRLRVKDVELQRREVLIREGKGGKDRITVLPASLVMVYTHVLNRGGRGVVSPLDR